MRLGLNIYKGGVGFWVCLCVRWLYVGVCVWWGRVCECMWSVLCMYVHA